jgi:hypothetical protein
MNPFLAFHSPFPTFFFKGTRHDYYMNELRIEFLEDWLDLLEAKGFDPAAIETQVLTRHMVKQLAPGQTVN